MPRVRRAWPVALALAALAASAGAGEPKPSAVVELVTLAPGVLHSGLGAAPDPTQTYELYLPKAFTPDRRWPLLLVFDPRARGRFAAEIFLPAAETRGWIVASSNNTMSDIPSFEPNLRAVNAMFPDLMARLPVDPSRVYATGFSGGAILAWLVGLQTGRLAGVISVGGRPPDGFESKPPAFAVWAAAGRTDFNFLPTRELDAIAERAGVPHRFETFPGPHAWFGADEAGRAIDWLETVAMAAGRRPREEAAIDSGLAAERAGAEALAAADELAAARRYAAIASTYRGLRDVAPDERRAVELAASPAARAAEKDEKWAARYEEQGRRRIAETLGLLGSDQPLPPPGKLRGTLGLAGLLEQARAGGRRGEAAERVLAAVASQFGFYLVRELFATGDFATAVAALSLAVEARPRDPFLWYNLACAQARIGSRGAALAALGHALDAGLPRPEQMATDPDLESLRAEPGFEALLARARAAPPPS